MHIAEQKATCDNTQPFIQCRWLSKEDVEKHPSKNRFLTKRCNKDYQNFK